MHRSIAALTVAGATIAASAVAVAADDGRIGPSLRIVNNGRHLTPYGRLVNVGNVPTGGALTPDGRFYWTVSAGRGLNDVRIVIGQVRARSSRRSRCPARRAAS